MKVQDLAREARSRLADPDNKDSLGSRLRLRRWQQLLDRFPDLADMRVLDLGGTTGHWEAVPVRPAHLTIVNLFPQEAPDDATVVLVGDACDPPSVLDGAEFDLVYSNSVLEHVGGHARRQHMADVVVGAGPHHWVQTPYRYFPVEPHWLFPGFQFLPVAVRAGVTERWPVGFYRGKGRAAVEEVLSTELIDKTEMRFLFPDSELVAERVAGLTKSIVAVA